MATKQVTKSVTVSAPNMQAGTFEIVGTSPLVVHRVSSKLLIEMKAKMLAGTTPAGKKKHEPVILEQVCEDGKYVGMTDGVKWEGFNAAGVRCALISACRLVNFKMTIAKMSVFVVRDGLDILNPLYQLVRIVGTAQRSELPAKTETGVIYLCVRPMYYPWSMSLNLVWDSDQFKLGDVANLLMRAGKQVGIGEGRYDSKNSAGQGWGAFDVKG
jgi:hypothetical protein